MTVALVLADAVLDLTTGTTTGARTLTAPANAGFVSVAAAKRPDGSSIAVNDYIFLMIRHQSADEWETGLYQYTAANQVTLVTLVASSTGSAVSFSAGNKDVMCGPLATMMMRDGFSKSNGDSAYTILPAETFVYTSAALTAARIWTLPPASARRAGTRITVSDLFGGITPQFPLTVTAAGSDNINAGTTFALYRAYDQAIFVTDGSSKWSVESRAGRLVELGRVVASNAASVSFDFAGGFPADFDDYEVHWNNLLPRTDSTYLFARAKTTGSLTQQSTGYTYGATLHGLSGDSNIGSTATGVTTLLPLTPLFTGSFMSSTSGEVGRGEFKFANPNAAAACPTRFESSHVRDSDSACVNYEGGGCWATTTVPITGWIFSMSSGNLDGTFVLYGIRK